MFTRDDPVAVGAQIERLIERIGTAADPQAGADAQELVRLLMTLYGSALGRVLDVVRTEHGGPEAVLDRLASDGLIASLLVLHDLHPHPVELRVSRALASLQPHVPPHITLTLLSVADDTVRLRVDVSGEHRHSPAGNLRAAVERAIQEAAPEIAAVHVDGFEQADTGPLIQITRP